MLPSHHNDRRQLLLDSVDSLRELIESHMNASESNRTLAKPVVEALRQAGLFGLAVPAQLGGVEANPMLQMEVIEALTTIYPSCGWSVTIGTGSTSILGDFLPDAGLQDLFADPSAQHFLRSDSKTRQWHQGTPYRLDVAEFADRLEQAEKAEKQGDHATVAMALALR